MSGLAAMHYAESFMEDDVNEWSRLTRVYVQQQFIPSRSIYSLCWPHLGRAAVHSFSFCLFPLLTSSRSTLTRVYVQQQFIPSRSIYSLCWPHLGRRSLVCTFSSSLFLYSCVRPLDLVVVVVRGPLFAIPISKRVVDAHPRVRCGDLFIQSITMHLASSQSHHRVTRSAGGVAKESTARSCTYTILAIPRFLNNRIFVLCSPGTSRVT
jgi:hypothetical protein